MKRINSKLVSEYLTSGLFSKTSRYAKISLSQISNTSDESSISTVKQLSSLIEQSIFPGNVSVCCTTRTHSSFNLLLDVSLEESISYRINGRV